MKNYILELPSSDGETTVDFQSGQSIVVVGANGSGKTRLGTWVEFSSRFKDVVHRISAQKSLSMPEYINTSDIDIAEAEFLWGYKDPIRNYGSIENAKRIQRWVVAFILVKS